MTIRPVHELTMNAAEAAAYGGMVDDRNGGARAINHVHDLPATRLRVAYTTPLISARNSS